MRFQALIAVSFCLFVACNGYSFVIPSTPRHPGVCIYNGLFLKRGDNSLPSTCQNMYCNEDGSILVQGCGHHDIGDCRVVDPMNLQKPYPECCKISFRCTSSNGQTVEKHLSPLDDIRTRDEDRNQGLPIGQHRNIESLIDGDRLVGRTQKTLEPSVITGDIHRLESMLVDENRHRDLMMGQNQNMESLIGGHRNKHSLKDQNLNRDTSGETYRQRDSGKAYNQRDSGANYRQQDNGETYRQRDSGKAYNQRDSGANYRQQDSGETYRQRDSGKAYNQRDSGANYRQQDSGVEYRQRNAGETYNQRDSGETYRQQDSGETYRQQDSLLLNQNRKRDSLLAGKQRNQNYLVTDGSGIGNQERIIGERRNEDHHGDSMLMTRAGIRNQDSLIMSGEDLLTGQNRYQDSSLMARAGIRNQDSLLTRNIQQLETLSDQTRNRESAIRENLNQGSLLMGAGRTSMEELALNGNMQNQETQQIRKRVSMLEQNRLNQENLNRESLVIDDILHRDSLLTGNSRIDNLLTANNAIRNRNSMLYGGQRNIGDMIEQNSNQESQLIGQGQRGIGVLIEETPNRDSLLIGENLLGQYRNRVPMIGENRYQGSLTTQNRNMESVLMQGGQRGIGGMVEETPNRDSILIGENLLGQYRNRNQGSLKTQNRNMESVLMREGQRGIGAMIDQTPNRDSLLIGENLLGQYGNRVPVIGENRNRGLLTTQNRNMDTVLMREGQRGIGAIIEQTPNRDSLLIGENLHGQYRNRNQGSLKTQNRNMESVLMREGRRVIGEMIEQTPNRDSLLIGENLLGQYSNRVPMIGENRNQGLLTTQNRNMDSVLMREGQRGIGAIIEQTPNRDSLLIGENLLGQYRNRVPVIGENRNQGLLTTQNRNMETVLMRGGQRGIGAIIEQTPNRDSLLIGENLLGQYGNRVPVIGENRNQGSLKTQNRDMDSVLVRGRQQGIGAMIEETLNRDSLLIGESVLGQYRNRVPMIGANRNQGLLTTQNRNMDSVLMQGGQQGIGVLMGENPNSESLLSRNIENRNLNGDSVLMGGQRNIDDSLIEGANRKQYIDQDLLLMSGNRIGDKLKRVALTGGNVQRVSLIGDNLQSDSMIGQNQQRGQLDLIVGTNQNGENTLLIGENLNQGDNVLQLDQNRNRAAIMTGENRRIGDTLMTADERQGMSNAWMTTGNTRDRFADIGAIRNRQSQLDGNINIRNRELFY